VETGLPLLRFYRKLVYRPGLRRFAGTIAASLITGLATATLGFSIALAANMGLTRIAVRG
jgi:hypothetical protein